MRPAAAWLGLVAILVACDAPEAPEAGGRTEGLFRLCNDESASNSVIEIDLASMQAHAFDVRTSARLCAEQGLACISYPMLLAAPPRMPRDESEVVRWTADGGHFAIRRVGEGPARYAITLSVTGEVPGRGRVTQRSWYDYHSVEGVTAAGFEGDPGIWRRCSGRLTFADLALLVSRLRKIQESRPR